MNNKKMFTTAVVTVILTTAFYLTPLGEKIYNTITSMSGDMTFSQKIGKIESLIEDSYINEYDKKKAENAALSYYAESLGDPYTVYIDEKNYSAMLESMGSDYQGIGVEVVIEGNDIRITSVFENTPAKKAGIQVGDVIVAVDGEVANGENYQESINKIKGMYAEKGDNDVVVTVMHNGEKKDITLIRETVSVDTVYSRVINSNTGYIRITDFGPKTYKEFMSHIDSLTNQKINGLVLDLRNNPGGMLGSVVNIADELLPEGTILTIKDKKGNETKYSSDESYINIPLCVIVNEESASASEVLSGAIRDLKRGKLVGKKTFGKGLVQSLVEFPDNSAFKLTTAKYYTPSGECIDKVGIKPDMEVSLDESLLGKSVSELTYDQDIQLKTAIRVLYE